MSDFPLLGPQCTTHKPHKAWQAELLRQLAWESCKTAVLKETLVPSLPIDDTNSLSITHRRFDTMAKEATEKSGIIVGPNKGHVSLT